MMLQENVAYSLVHMLLSLSYSVMTAHRLEMGEAEGQPGKWKTARMASLVLYTTVVSLVRNLQSCDTMLDVF